MKTYFIRHKHENPQRIKDLQKNNLISFFYDDLDWSIVSDQKFWDDKKDSDNKKYYSTYRSSVNFFKEISEHGGWIFSEYGDSQTPSGIKGCLLGEVIPGTKVKFFNNELKVTLQMKNVVEVNYSKYPVLLAIRPPYGTICSPTRKTYASIAENLILKKQFKPELTLMHPSVVEQMCVEYLRIFGITDDPSTKLNYLFLNVGKTMATFDIAGRLINGKKVFCQVKHGPIHDDVKINFINSIPNDAIGIIYADNVENKSVGNIFFRNIKNMYERLENENPQMIHDMIGIAA